MKNAYLLLIALLPAFAPSEVRADVIYCQEPLTKEIKAYNRTACPGLSRKVSVGNSSDPIEEMLQGATDRFTRNTRAYSEQITRGLEGLRNDSSNEEVNFQPEPLANNTCIAGSWSGNLIGRGGEIPIELQISMNGYYTLRYPKKSVEAETYPLTSSNTHDAVFGLRAEDGRRVIQLRTSVAVNEDAMQGTIEDGSGSTRIRAERTSETPSHCLPSNPASTNSQSRGSSLVEDLNRLQEFYDQGILNDEEFNAAKRRLLGL